MTCAFASIPESSRSSLIGTSPMTSSWRERVISGRMASDPKSSEINTSSSQAKSVGKQRQSKKIIGKSSTLSKVKYKSTTLHKLNSSWKLFYHSPTLQDWTLSSYTEVAEFQTVEEFWIVFHKFDEKYFHMGMFFFMRGNIKPTWEDASNRSGGCWSYKIPMKHIYSVWKELSIRLVGESLSSTPMLLNGLSISPKRGFCIIKIWGKDHKCSDFQTLQLNGVEYVTPSEVIYTSFKDKK